MRISSYSGPNNIFKFNFNNRECTIGDYGLVLESPCPKLKNMVKLKNLFGSSEYYIQKHNKWYDGNDIDLVHEFILLNKDKE